MAKTILIVEDENITREGFVLSFKDKNWNVLEAINGEDALNLLKSNIKIDIMLLDLRMHGKDGYDVLNEAQGLDILPKSIVICSAHLDDQAWKKLIGTSVHMFIPKPITPEILPDLLDPFLFHDSAIIIENFKKIVEEKLNLFVFDHPITCEYLYIFLRDTDKDMRKFHEIQQIPEKRLALNTKTEQREKWLLNYFKKHADQPIHHDYPEPVLVIARRWNSWYPSYFNVDGGSYIVLGPKSMDNSVSGTIIDPGFRALSILKNINIPVSSLNTCLITHNHPDHMGGLFEYLTSRHVLKENTNLYCTEAVHRMLSSYVGSKVDLKKFDKLPLDLIQNIDKNGVKRRIKATPVETTHFEAGQLDGIRAILLSSDTSEENGNFETIGTAFILGDTDYQSNEDDTMHEIYDKIRETFLREDLKVAILHIGSSQLKEGTCKHLYLKGIIDLLKDIDNDRRRKLSKKNKNKLLILVSEWGLEHASNDQIRNAMPDIDSTDVIENNYGTDNLIIETIELINELCRFERIKLIPADIGLVVGIESGKIYINGNSIDNEQLDFISGREGIEFKIK